MTREEAVSELRLHIVQCGMLMPIDWVRKNSSPSSDFMQAMQIAIETLEATDGKRRTDDGT